MSSAYSQVSIMCTIWQPHSQHLTCHRKQVTKEHVAFEGRLLMLGNGCICAVRSNIS